MLSKEAKFLRILGDETKLTIIKYLLDGELCVCELLPITKRAQSTVSSHLNDLENAQILTSRREGRNIFYKIKDKRIFELCNLLGIRGAKIKHSCIKK